jgi:hypothetical protein
MEQHLTQTEHIQAVGFRYVGRVEYRTGSSAALMMGKAQVRSRPYAFL